MEVIFDNFWNESITYYNDNYDYMQLSLGEKAKLNLAVSLALFSLFRVNLGGTSLLFIDEAFSHIDEASIEKYISLLRTTYSIDTAIFIVSHEYGLRNFSPDATYIVSKKNGESLLRIG
jgi:DNA repair exonuclease SbcCD ATPase subunit